MKHCLTLVLLVIFSFLQAQDQKAEKIAKHVGDYFFLERENIHVQASKGIYFTNETIWLKGYVYHRKKGEPFFSTTNIHAVLIDPDGKVIDTRLLYSNLGSFVGYFPLDKAMPSGKYHLQFYTNWMNNFSEDESFVKEITIINEKDNPANALQKNRFTEVKINVSPEGGTYLNGVTNIFGINVSGCNGTPAPVNTVNIVGRDGKVITQVQLNKLGNGRLEVPAGKEPVKIIATVNGKLFESPFPQMQDKGFAMNVNNYTIPGTTVINVNTNAATSQSYAGKPVYMLVHQDDKSFVFLLNFAAGTTTQSVAIPSANLPAGLNTIRLIDENLTELGVRLVYNYPTVSVSAYVAKTKKKDKGFQLEGQVSNPNMNLSISVLPQATISADEKEDLYGSLKIAPYIMGTDPAGRHYFTTLTKGKHYELDIYLLSQKPKCLWYNIINNPPKHSFTFDMGVTLKGKLPPGVSYDKSNKIRLYALGGINEYVGIKENREFEFDHLIIQDSSWVSFTLAKLKEKNPKELTILPQTINGRMPYFKMYKPEPPCDLAPPDENSGTYSNPAIYKNIVVLDEVTVEGKTLKYATSFGNANLTGYKMSDYNASNINILTWLKLYSTFDVVDNISEVSILSRSRISIGGGAAGPIVYIDNVQQFDLSVLRNILVDEVDELYMNAHTIVPSVRNYIGTIKIYLKKGGKRNSKNSTPDIVVKNAFQRAKRFENAQYINTSGKAFEDFALIDWHPIITTDEKGNFTFEIPHTLQKTVKLLIEGFSADGKLISEIKTIEVN